MIVYVDSSVVLRTLLKEPGPKTDWFGQEGALSSELMVVEVRRALERLRLLGKLDDAEIAKLIVLLRELTSGFQRIPIGRDVLERAASPFPTLVATLDAIHLATALLWTERTGQAPVFLTHDRQLALAARACGLEVAG